MPAVWGKLRRLERVAKVGDFRLPSQAPHFYPTGGFNLLFEKMLNGFDVRYTVHVHHVEIEGKWPQIVTSRTNKDVCRSGGRHRSDRCHLWTLLWTPGVERVPR
jgi:hypothetical protein